MFRQGESLQATAERINQSSKASTRITELSPAEAEKEQGNEAFKRQDYVEVSASFRQHVCGPWPFWLWIWVRQWVTANHPWLFMQAFEHYSKAIEMDPSLTVAYNNRAMTRLKLGDWLGAEADCDSVLTKDPTSIKALHRRATAR